MLGGEPLRRLPERRELDPVDALAPWVPRHEARLVEAATLQLFEQGPCGEGTELVEARGHGGEHVVRQSPFEIAPEEAIRAEGILERGRRLEERHRSIPRGRVGWQPDRGGRIPRAWLVRVP